jgi:hydrogenase maturation protein HypF
MTTRIRAKIIGRVQGVGFRPTVYRYARQFGLAGFVCNGPHGVTLEVEGDDNKVGEFFNRLTHEPPRQAVIANIKTEVLSAKGYQSFEVVPSEPVGEVAVHIAPDLEESPVWLRVHQLYQLRPAVHNHPRCAVRPREDVHGGLRDV